MIDARRRLGVGIFFFFFIPRISTKLHIAYNKYQITCAARHNTFVLALPLGYSLKSLLFACISLLDYRRSGTFIWRISLLEMGSARRVNLPIARDGLSWLAAISALELKCYYVSDTFLYSLLHHLYFLPTGFLLQMRFEGTKETKRGEKSDSWYREKKF